MKSDLIILSGIGIGLIILAVPAMIYIIYTLVR
jgi:uncharacterized membrane protein YukC